MEEFLKSLELGKWGILLLGLYLIWRFILKNAFEIWLKNTFDYKNKSNLETLKSQRELVLKQLEFEKVKLERILPFIENINETIRTYSMMRANYFVSIANKLPLSQDFEKKRLEQDEQILESISKVSIYIKPEFRQLLNKIRKLISCSWRDPLIINTIVKECASMNDVMFTARKLTNSLNDCFYDMCKFSIEVNSDETDFKVILGKYGFDENIEPIEKNEITMFVWQFILFHEYYDNSDIMHIQDKTKKKYKGKI